MKKLSKNDIVIRSPGLQIREKIIEKFGDVKTFADAIGMYDSSVEQYLTTKNLGSSTFKIKLINAFGKSLNELYLTDEAQIRKISLSISENINAYNQHGDVEILEKIKDICIKRELLEDYAIVCRAYAIFFYNQMKMDRALAYMQLAVNYLRGKEPIDRFVHYLSELILIEAEISLRSRINKLFSECISLIDEIKEERIISDVFINIGKSFFKLGDLCEARRYYIKSLQLCNSKNKIADVYQLMGDLSIINSDYKEAFDFYSKSKEVLNESDHQMIRLNHKFAVYYQLIHEYEVAEYFIDSVVNSLRYDITSTDNKYLVTYAEIKMHFGKEKEVLVEIRNLLNELGHRSIYAERHIKQLENIVEIYRFNLDFLNNINNLLIGYCFENNLEQDFLNAIKIVIGRTVVETHCVNRSK